VPQDDLYEKRLPEGRSFQGVRLRHGIRSNRSSTQNEGGIQKMAAIKFNPGKPSGIGVETATGERWITQGAWKFDPVTKELLPGQAPEQSLTPPDFSVAPGGIEKPDLPEGLPPAGVTTPGAAPRDPVTPPGGSSNNLNFGSPPTEEEIRASIADPSEPAIVPFPEGKDNVPGELFDISMPVEEKPLQGGSDPVDSHPVAAAEDAKALPGKKSSRKG
jgi:hypothetical protein